MPAIKISESLLFVFLSSFVAIVDWRRGLRSLEKPQNSCGVWLQKGRAAAMPASEIVMVSLTSIDPGLPPLVLHQVSFTFSRVHKAPFHQVYYWLYDFALHVGSSFLVRRGSVFLNPFLLFFAKPQIVRLCFFQLGSSLGYHLQSVLQQNGFRKMAIMIMPKSINLFGCCGCENAEVNLDGLLALAGYKFCSRFKFLIADLFFLCLLRVNHFLKKSYSFLINIGPFDSFFLFCLKFKQPFIKLFFFIIAKQ